jgi:preprotein translocase subunit SecY
MGDSESASDTRNREDGPAQARARQDATGRAWWWATGAGVITAIAVFVALPERSVPLALVSVAASRDVRGVDAHGGVKITYRAAAGDAGDGAAFAQTARIIERRAMEIGYTDVLVTDREITVEVAGVAPEAGEDVARTLISRGELSFHKIVDGSELARALYTRANAGADASVSVGEDRWFHDETGRTFEDYYLMAPTRAALERFLARAAAEDPALAPEPGRVFLSEHVRPEPIGFDDPEADAPFWRTYYAEAKSELRKDHIADAEVYWDPITARAAVLVTLDEAGAERFHELTRSHVGHKLAMVLDEVVTSAPVIQDAIPGGRVTITMGGSSNAQIEAEARALVAILKSRTNEPLPVALAVVDAAPIASTVTFVEHIRAALLLALLAGLAAFVLVRAVEHRAPRLDVALPGPAGARPWGRLAVTVAALAVVHAGTSMLLPGTNDMMIVLVAGGGELDGQLSVFALGIMPFVSAFLVIEVAALLMPRWRPLRIGGPAGRARLTRATIILGVLFTLAQSWFMATWLVNLAAGDPMSGYSPGLSLPPGPASTALLAITLAGGVMALWILAGLVSRYGLGNGISVLLFAGITGVPASLWSMREATPENAGAGAEAGITIALLGIALCALIVVISRVLRTRAGGPLGLRLPTCGIVPMTEANALLALPASILALGGATGAMAGAAAWVPDGIAIRLALVAALAVGFSLLFSRPSLTAGHVRAVDAGAAEQRAGAFWLATSVSAAYVVGIAGLAWLLVRWAPPSLQDALWLAVCTAIVMDLVSEWRARRRCRDLVAVWPVHRVQLADVAVRALQDSGIGAHTRGRYHRSLLYFFGPFVPIEIMVPAERAEEAAGLLGNVLAGDAPAPQPREDSDRSAARSSIL